MKKILLALVILAPLAAFGYERPGSDLIIIRPGSDAGVRQQAIRAAQQTRHELQQLASEAYDYGDGNYFGFEVGNGRRPGHGHGYSGVSELAGNLADALQYDVIQALRHGERLGQVGRRVDYLLGDLSELAEEVRYSDDSNRLAFRFGRVVKFFRQLQSLL